MIPIQSTVVGYLGKAATVFSAYDETSRVLVVSVEAAYKKERREGCIVITNDATLERDSLFDNDKIQDSIIAFYGLQTGVAEDGKSTRLVFADKAQRANPNDSIEKDGIDSRGQRFRISDDISCAKVATLSACWYAFYRAGLSQSTQSMHDKLLHAQLNISAAQLNQGVFFTI